MHRASLPRQLLKTGCHDTHERRMRTSASMPDHLQRKDHGYPVIATVGSCRTDANIGSNGAPHGKGGGAAELRLPTIGRFTASARTQRRRRRRGRRGKPTDRSGNEELARAVAARVRRWLRLGASTPGGNIAADGCSDAAKSEIESVLGHGGSYEGVDGVGGDVTAHRHTSLQATRWPPRKCQKKS